jgi:hypothetical protein
LPRSSEEAEEEEDEEEEAAAANDDDDDDNEEEEEDLGGTQTVEETLERIPLFEVLLLLLVGEICQQQQQLPVLALWYFQCFACPFLAFVFCYFPEFFVLFFTARKFRSVMFSGR